MGYYDCHLIFLINCKECFKIIVIFLIHVRINLTQIIIIQSSKSLKILQIPNFTKSISQCNEKLSEVFQGETHFKNLIWMFS